MPLEEKLLKSSERNLELKNQENSRAEKLSGLISSLDFAGNI